jgi:hypothetical protein
MKIISKLHALRSFANWGRYLSTGTLKRIPIELVTNEFGFSFASDGWNYFRAIIAEYEKDPTIHLEKSTFFRFFQDDRVKSVRYLNDLLFLHDAERRARHKFKFYLGTYPWGEHVGGGPWGHYYDCVEGKDSRDLYGYRVNLWHEPGDKHAIESEWEQTIKLYQSVRGGYRPFRSRDLPEVTLLVRRDGEMRAMRYNGQHRLSILSHLGYRKITAVIPSAKAITKSLATFPTLSSLPKVVYEREVVVREADVEEWYYVRQGLCTAAEALDIFHAFFELNGRERIEYLGIPSAY